MSTNTETTDRAKILTIFEYVKRQLNLSERSELNILLHHDFTDTMRERSHKCMEDLRRLLR